MSRKRLMVAFAVLSITSASGAVANEIRYDNAPIVREGRSMPVVREFRLNEETTASGSRSVESADSHLVKAGIVSGFKKIVTKVGKAIWNKRIKEPGKIEYPNLKIT